ncbi:TonB-dependent receptor [Acinetobacter qingfengensis]|uniref:Secretin/TonB short N-terminal domain-containing protein n=2 Tax=Acinetobacter qingfengensis TaxID=1262585 RepID=A0A1E7RD78_9GAMM|nr:TonB-dependent receptor [Acinetobacter qingfengensis]OEY97291.1 hypothetical protein BJI46_02290 [Acinetobacter qingfengensis]
MIVKPLSLAIQISLFAGSTFLICHPAYAQSNASQFYNIPAGQLSDALVSFSLQSGTTLTVDHQKLKGFSSQALKGSYTIEDGFNQLLQQTPYQIQKNAAGYGLVEKPRKTASPQHYVGQLKQLDIQAKGSNPSGEVAQLPAITVNASDNTPLNRQTTIGVLGNKKVLDTPYSVNVKTAEEIEERQTNSLGKIFVGDPSIVTQVNSYSSGWSTPVSIRGLQLDVSNSYKVNGHTVSAWGGEFPVEVTESVTAIKGLSGLMYGFASPGGTIDYQTKQPTENDLLTTTVGYRSAGIFSAHLDAGGRIGEDKQFGYRFNIAKEKGETYNGSDADNLVTGLALDYRITPDLVWKGEVIYQDRHLDNEATMFMFGSYTGTALPKAISGSKKHIVNGAFYTIHTALADTGLYWQINDDWKAQLSYAYARQRNYVNKTFGYILNQTGDYSINMYELGGVDIRQQTQAILTGQFDTGFLKHELVTGASYRKNSGSYSSYDWYANVGSGNIYQENSTSYANKNSFTLTDSGNLYQKELFASDTIHFNEHWQALLGARFTQYNDQSSDYRKDVTTPTYALIYKPVENLAIYASYVEALQAGKEVSASASKPYANAGQTLDPTISEQYEIGAKYDHSKWNASIAFYRLEKAAQIDEYRGSLLYLTQNGITRYQGIELIGGYKFSPDLNINAGLLLADPTLEKLTSGNEALQGNRPAGTSKIQAVLQTNWTVPYWQGVSIHSDIRYFGNNYYNDKNSLLLPSYTLVNLGGAYKTRISNTPVTFRADINNLFNKKYWMNSGVGEPLTLALSAKIDW